MTLPRPTSMQRQLARRLRGNQTDCELRLWQQLRARQLLDVKFRRQHPCPPYVLDFYCVQLQLAIELDGSQHLLPEALTYDLRRSRYLQSLGITVLRFDNLQVIDEMEGVLHVIFLEVQRRLQDPHPNPLPKGEGT
ncbi:endonuclease domain-containing protein [Pseudomonas weihenstephanensis]|uniref:endonuclease domain-containing protein n=1 Tax=Pseudomonas weihenstephanensis TaxID=1608994 RepID=UPI0006541700|nr:endonuclease domain-containing protein [Pseudomonas weihenstephanensis]KMN18078.1 hypothetical protein TU87_12030 [Pseudomonas weihenstephanensis]